MSRTAKTIAEEVLTPARVRELWTANYFPALPFTPQHFDIGTLLPAMLYMARWGQRRGKGAFKEAFGSKTNGKAEPPTIDNVASGLLVKQAGAFVGFGEPHARFGEPDRRAFIVESRHGRAYDRVALCV